MAAKPHNTQQHAHRYGQVSNKLSLTLTRTWPAWPSLLPVSQEVISSVRGIRLCPCVSYHSYHHTTIMKHWVIRFTFYNRSLVDKNALYPLISISKDGRLISLPGHSPSLQWIVLHLSRMTRPGFRSSGEVGQCVCRCICTMRPTTFIRTLILVCQSPARRGCPQNGFHRINPIEVLQMHHKVTDSCITAACPLSQNTLSLWHLLLIVIVQCGQVVRQAERNSQQAPVTPHGVSGVEEKGQQALGVNGQVWYLQVHAQC